MKLDRLMMAASLVACGAGAVACHKAAATGQVLATVAGKDITLQDVRAEGRATGVPATAGQAADVALLQRVVDRTLFARSAHAQHLDQTPDAPSDLARLQQTWLADKAAQRELAGITPPTDAQARAFIAAHANLFAKREQIKARTINIAYSPTLYNQLKTYENYDQALAFLKRLGVALNTGVGTIDTAQLPPAAATQIMATAIGTLVITQQPHQIQLAEIQSHTPVVLNEQEQLNLAKREIVSAAAHERVATALKKLKAQTPVTYQSGYAPPAVKAAPEASTSGPA